MTNRKRWMNAIVAEAAKCEHKMPWERGARRAEMIARRATLDTSAIAAARKLTLSRDSATAA